MNIDTTNSLSASLRRVDSLDGFRAIAITAVLGFHVPVMWPTVPKQLIPMRDGGFIGVDMFFVLSGFLITGLLIKEQTKSQSVNFKRFFLRRVIRLLPPLLVCIFVSLGLAIHFNDDIHTFLLSSLLGIFYLFNWGVVFDLKRSYQLGHLWSLSLEEQYYSAIALVVYLYRRLKSLISLRRLIVIVSSSLILWSFFAKIYILRNGNVGENWAQLYFRTDLRSDSFFIGSLTAVFRDRQLSQPTKLINMTFIPSCFLLIVYMISTNADNVINYRGGLTLVAVASACVILAASYPGTLADKLLSTRILKSIGILSYSIYLIHMPIFTALSPYHSSIRYPIRLLLSIVLVFAYSLLSYYILEKPLSRIRRKYLS
jgi:peptidoglycan/LPS O-acetylase OafA/YrhL